MLNRHWCLLLNCSVHWGVAPNLVCLQQWCFFVILSNCLFPLSICFQIEVEWRLDLGIHWCTQAKPMGERMLELSALHQNHCCVAGFFCGGRRKNLCKCNWCFLLKLICKQNHCCPLGWGCLEAEICSCCCRLWLEQHWLHWNTVFQVNLKGMIWMLIFFQDSVNGFASCFWVLGDKIGVTW